MDLNPPINAHEHSFSMEFTHAEWLLISASLLFVNSVLVAESDADGRANRKLLVELLLNEKVSSPAALSVAISTQGFLNSLAAIASGKLE